MKTALTDPDAGPPLARCIHQLSHLKQGGTKWGKAPHKPVLLLTLMELIASRKITENQIRLTPDLVEGFRANFEILASPGHEGDVTLPFFYLKNGRVLVSQSQQRVSDRYLHPKRKNMERTARIRPLFG